MTTRYVNYVSGNDTTGNGSAATPYKTVVKAAISPSLLVGGDEIRIAKTYTRPGSPEISVDFTFEGYSAVAYGDVTTLIPAGTVIGNDTIGYYKVQNPSYFSGMTGFDLGLPFPFPTQNAGCFVIQMVSTPAATNPSDTVEMVTTSYAGSSETNRIKISGGWNLSGTPAQDGETWLRAGADQKGYMYKTNQGCYTFEKLNFVGFYTGIRVSGNAVYVSNVRTVYGFTGLDCYACYGTKITDFLSCCDAYPINATAFGGSTVTNFSAFCPQARGLYMSSMSSSNMFINTRVIGPQQDGIILENAHLNIFKGLEIKNVGAYGLMLNAASGNKFYNTSIIYEPMFNYAWFPSDNLNGSFSLGNFFEDLEIVANDTGGGVSLDRCTAVMRRASIDLSAISGNIYAGTSQGTELRIYQRDGAADGHEIYNWHGYIHTVTSPARSGLAWEMLPNADAKSSDSALSLPPFQIALKASTTYTVSCYVYLTSPCSARLYCRGGQLTGIPSDVTSSTTTTAGSWVQLSLSVTPTERGVVEIEVQAWGSGAGTEACVVDEVKVS